MNFIPDPGSLFYTAVKPRLRQVVEGSAFTETKIRTVAEQDGSYQEDIFKCIARDDTHMVAERLTGYHGGDKKYLFRIDGYIFNPVGPTVAAAMGLASEHIQTPLDGE